MDPKGIRGEALWGSWKLKCKVLYPDFFLVVHLKIIQVHMDYFRNFEVRWVKIDFKNPQNGGLLLDHGATFSRFNALK